MGLVTHMTDATGESHSLRRRRARLVSLVPSHTETLFTLGAGERVTGVTRFCVRPDRALRTARNVGGTKSPDIEAIVALEPDLVFANQEENRREDILRLRESVPVYVAFPKTVPEAIDDIRATGRLLDLELEADTIAARLVERLESLRRTARPFRFLYFIWQRPYLVAGHGTFIDASLSEAGGENAAPSGRGRYPEISTEEIAASGADVLLLSSEPFPFDAGHRAALKKELRSDSEHPPRVELVDGQLLSWHGTRLLEGLPYLASLAAGLRERRHREPAPR